MVVFSYIWIYFLRVPLWVFVCLLGCCVPLLSLLPFVAIWWCYFPIRRFREERESGDAVEVRTWCHWVHVLQTIQYNDDNTLHAWSLVWLNRKLKELNLYSRNKWELNGVCYKINRAVSLLACEKNYCYENYPHVYFVPIIVSLAVHCGRAPSLLSF